VSPLTLAPAFSPLVHDYYVRCAAGDNALSVTMTASAGATASLTMPTVSASAQSQTLSVHALENQAIVATATKGGSSNAYWVRCLPHDFPKLVMNAHPAAGSPPPGYYLVGDTFHATGESGYAMLVDVRGTPVWYATTKNGAGPINVELLDSNTISYAPFDTYVFGISYVDYEIHSLRPPGVTYVNTVGAPLDTHELRRLSNGDYLIFAAPVVMGLDLTGIGTHGPNENAVGCVLQELAPSGDVVWQWNAMDHFDPQDCTFCEDAKGQMAGSPTLFDVVDVFHCNSVDLDPNGDILISARNMDSMFLISKATGKVLWKMGGSAHVKDGEPFIQVTGDALNGFFRQHHASFLPDGTISVFDDETNLNAPARGVVVSYDVAKQTASIVWQYSGTSNSAAMGSFQVLPDGSHVIGWGLSAANPVFTEVNANGDDLLDFGFSNGDSSYRALKVPTSAVDLDVLRQAVAGTTVTAATQDGGSVRDAGAADADATTDASGSKDAGSDTHVDAP